MERYFEFNSRGAVHPVEGIILLDLKEEKIEMYMPSSDTFVNVEEAICILFSHPEILFEAELLVSERAPYRAYGATKGIRQKEHIVYEEISDFFDDNCSVERKVVWKEKLWFKLDIEVDDDQWHELDLVVCYRVWTRLLERRTYELQWEEITQ